MPGHVKPGDWEVNQSVNFLDVVCAVPKPLELDDEDFWKVVDLVLLCRKNLRLASRAVPCVR